MLPMLSIPQTGPFVSATGVTMLTWLKNRSRCVTSSGPGYNMHDVITSHFKSRSHYCALLSAAQSRSHFTDGLDTASICHCQTHTKENIYWCTYHTPYTGVHAQTHTQPNLVFLGMRPATVGMAMSVCGLVQHFCPDSNILTMTEETDVKSCTYICGAVRMKPINFGDRLDFSSSAAITSTF